jgi:hypothetical protein
MKNINWWKVASMAMLAASAIMGFGHDLIEDQKTEDDLRDMVQKEVRKQLSEKNL